jgi:hypothetical protein
MAARRHMHAGKTGSLGMKFRILTIIFGLGMFPKCLSFKFHFEDITKFIE